MKNLRTPDGWFYSNLCVFQKVNKKVYCYIIPSFGGYIVHLYMRKNTEHCEAEFRTNSLKEAFRMGDVWLEKYGNSEKEVIHTNFWCPWNPKGYWQNRGRGRHSIKQLDLMKQKYEEMYDVDMLCEEDSNSIHIHRIRVPKKYGSVGVGMSVLKEISNYARKRRKKVKFLAL